MDIGSIIAANLKRLRNERNLSLGQLGELSGVSKVMLSQIERGETNPTINTVWKVANGLKVPYTALLEQAVSDVKLVRRGDLCPQTSDQGCDRLYCHFPTTPARNFELFEMELDEHAVYHSIGHSEKSEEYVLLTQGEIAIMVEETVYALHAGDSLGFPAVGKHTYTNTGGGVAKLVIINYYPV